MLKIVQVTTSCKDCPKRRYGSGGQYDCTAMDNAPLPADCVIPQWCPLPNHPGKLAAEAIAKADNTLAVTRQLRDAVASGNGSVEWTKSVLDQAVLDLEHWKNQMSAGA